MQGFNHIAGGYAFTGLFCSFADLNIFDSPITLAVVGVASLLPDVDHTKSLIGKSVFPLASWLSRNYGHRTVTHSIFFFTAVVCIAQ
jgi:inner membrane protein